MGKVVHVCLKKFLPKFKIIRMKNTRVMGYIRKINSLAAFRGVERSTCTKLRARVFCKTKFSRPKNCLIALFFFHKVASSLKELNCTHTFSVA